MSDFNLYLAYLGGWASAAFTLAIFLWLTGGI
jgi:hypothetical protein